MSRMTPEEEARIRKELPHTTAALLGIAMGRNRYSIERKARELGATVRNSPELMPDHTALLTSTGHTELVEALKNNPVTFLYHKGRYGRGNE